MKFNEWLRKARLENCLSQRELADALGVTTPTICNLETGKTKPRLDVQKRICEFFNIETKELNKMMEE